MENIKLKSNNNHKSVFLKKTYKKKYYYKNISKKSHTIN